MRLFHDWEFIDDGKTIQPVSAGMVADDGRELYAVMPFDEYQLLKNPWMVENVWPSLPTKPCTHRCVPEIREYGHIDLSHPDVRSQHQVKRMIHQFCKDAGPGVELWGYYPAYDHVVMAQLFGPMINLPPEVPKLTQCLQQEVMRLDKIGLNATQIKKSLPNPAEHNALGDARWNRQLAVALDSLRWDRENR